MTLENLYQLIVTRKEEMPENSYLTSLFTEGDDRIIQKVGEEAVEVVIAAKGTDKERVISEMADLWFHSLVLLANKGITPEDILVELEKRDKKK